MPLKWKFLLSSTLQKAMKRKNSAISLSLNEGNKLYSITLIYLL